MLERLINRFTFWWYRKEIKLLIDFFMDDDKYKNTGIAKTPDQMLQFAKQNKISKKKISKIIRYCIKMDIIQDMPVRDAKKQFYYIINPNLLK